MPEELKRILILEANPDHLELLSALIDEHFSPVDIHTVETVEDCLDFLEQTEYDLVLTSCFINNASITDRLKHIVETAAGAPVVVISGSTDTSIAAEVIKKGAADYVVKTKKSIEKIPPLIAKHLKRGKKAKPAARQAPEGAEVTRRLVRELDHLMQKARALTSSVAQKDASLEGQPFDSIFSQIQRLRKLLQEQK
jgi:DNA-binding NtrC family response regulator